MAASRFLATMLCKWTEQNVTVLGAPTGGLRRSPRTTNAARPLFDDQVLDRVWQPLLRRMARPPSSEYVLNWSEMCGTWSWASWSNTALKAPTWL